MIAPFRPRSGAACAETAPAPAALPDLDETARAFCGGLAARNWRRQVQVRWHSRLRTTAGQAYYAKSLVRMNPKLMQFGMEEVDKTLRHELAHLVARFRAGGSAGSSRMGPSGGRRAATSAWPMRSAAMICRCRGHASESGIVIIARIAGAITTGSGRSAGRWRAWNAAGRMRAGAMTSGSVW